MKDLSEVIKRNNISIAIIAAPPDSAASVAEVLVNAGIKGILNFTTVPLNVPSTVFLEEYDMITLWKKLHILLKLSESV
jgi:redox-sensing transcriptional repressor